MPLKAGAIDALIPKAGGQPLPQFFPALPRVGVSVTNLDVEPFLEDGTRAVNREVAFKRIPVGLDFADPLLSDDIKNAFGEAFGVTFCEEPISDESFVEGPAPCFDPQPANLNPSFLGFQLLPETAELPQDGLIEDVEVDLAPRGARLSVSSGGTLVVNPVFALGTSQRYQIVRFLIEESTLIVENRFEDIVVTWYATRGTIGQPVRQLQTGDTFGQVWNLPQTATSGEEDVLVAVARRPTRWDVVRHHHGRVPVKLIEHLVDAAEAAGALLRARQRAPREIETKSSSVDLVTDADPKAESLIVDRLSSAFPGAGFLLEEGGEARAPGSGNAALTFVVDPLDGTTNFASQIPHYAVNIGVEREGERVAACTLDVCRHELFIAERGGRRLCERPAFAGLADHASLDDAVLATGFAYLDDHDRDDNHTEFAALNLSCRGVRRFGAAAARPRVGRRRSL